MATLIQNFHEGEWVVRTTDFSKSKGDFKACEWLIVRGIDGENIVAERYDDETGEPEAITGPANSFISTGVTEPDDAEEKILECISNICPDLTDEEWKCVKAMAHEA